MNDPARTSGSLAFGNLLRRYRLGAGLSQEALAERARMSADGISALERGRRLTPRRDTLELLVGALALGADERRTFELAAGRSTERRGAGASIAIGPWSDAGIPTLPLSLTSFVGRAAVLDEIAALVRAHRLVTLVGTGGVGKTQTALRVATALGIEEAVRFVSFAPLRDARLVVNSIAAALCVQEVPNHPLLETLLVYLKNRAPLLIFDNCEQVITQIAFVAESLLRGAPRVRILATSREPIRAGGEHVYRLPSLGLPDAVTLFADRARAVNHRIELGGENATIVDDICRRLDGIPLAIELAAARADMLSLRELAQKLDHRFAILTHGERTALPRQQTMRAAIDWSYEMLTTPQRRLLEHLSVFAGGCTLETAIAACAGGDAAEDDLLELLSSLVDKSLVMADINEGKTRYRLLESFRQYAGEKLAARGEAEACIRAHAMACLELSRRLNRAYATEPDEIWQALARDELDNWRIALQWTLVDRNDVLAGQRLAGELRLVWRRIPREGHNWVGRALEFVTPGTPDAVVAQLHLAAAVIAHADQDRAAELRHAEIAIAEFRRSGDACGVGHAQGYAGYALTWMGRFTDAKPLLEEALAAGRAFGNPRLAAFALCSLGAGSALAGDLVAARDLTMQARQIYDASASKTAVATALDVLAWVEFRAGNAELAVRLATEAIATAGDLVAVGNTGLLGNLSGYLIALGRYEEADARAREWLALARDQQRDASAALALQHLVLIAAQSPRCAVSESVTARGRAARILGFVDARLSKLESVRIVSSRAEYDRAFVALRDALGADALANEMATGATMTEDQAVEEAQAM